ncbi:MAG: molecular chaperone TorD family protein [Candidatus Bathyarchaeia archaeon]
MNSERSSVTEIVKVSSARAALYRFLSRGFGAEVDESFIETIQKMHPILLSLAADNDSQDFKQGTHLLGQFVGMIRSDYEKDRHLFLEDLAADFASLFLNADARSVHPVESVYLGEHHLLYEEPYDDVVRIYDLFGFKKKRTVTEPEDHLAVELEFMAHLCDLTVHSLGDKRIDYAIGFLGNQSEFLDRHLSKWAPLFSGDLKSVSTNKLYSSLAHLLQGFLSTEASTILQTSEMANPEKT